MKIVVIDGQGGNLGRQLVKGIKDRFPDTYVRAIGTNSTATANMLKAGADEAATGENAVVVGSRIADVIVGPAGIVIPDALLGEVTSVMANAIGSADAQKILIPMNRCDVLIAGVQGRSTSELIDDAVKMLCDIIR
ncbi:MAG: DUF3842 family protein [Erysipelotrichaceae bacterium]|nr:DUF3842 family protein [Erysipelotrichaceae bacterium]